MQPLQANPSKTGCQSGHRLARVLAPRRSSASGKEFRSGVIANESPRRADSHHHHSDHAQPPAPEPSIVLCVSAILCKQGSAPAPPPRLRDGRQVLSDHPLASAGSPEVVPGYRTMIVCVVATNAGSTADLRLVFRFGPHTSLRSTAPHTWCSLGDQSIRRCPATQDGSRS
jgi:hypothetical protein